MVNGTVSSPGGMRRRRTRTALAFVAGAAAQPGQKARARQPVQPARAPVQDQAAGLGRQHRLHRPQPRHPPARMAAGDREAERFVDVCNLIGHAQS